MKLNRADIIRPYRATKDYSENNKSSQELKRAEQSPTPTERNKTIATTKKSQELNQAEPINYSAFSKFAENRKAQINM